MKTIDKYIAWSFIKSLCMASVAFTMLICITYIFDKISIVLKYKAPMKLLFVSLFYSLPAWISLTFPVAMLLAALFSIGNLARNNEITALRTAGIDTLRISASIIVIGLLLTAFFIFFNNTLVVNFNKQYTRIWKYEIKKQKRNLSESFNIVQTENDKIISAKLIDSKNEKITGFSMLLLDREHNIKEKLSSEEAVWENGYLLLKNPVWIFSGQKGNISIKQEKEAKIFFPKKPSEFITSKANPDEMSYREINELCIRMKKSGIPSHKENVYKHSKLARPIANLIMLLIGIPFAMKTAKTAKIFSFSVSIFLGFVYWGIESVGMALGMNNTWHPLMAAWFANALFLITASYLIYKNR
ncbi:MAG: putative permease YjgP/YjgQ family protein [Elusimicrobia bacterium ADurb.Bin231]|nr:MAG: putative permease YjgP/YjgQ family protein [Elusimicrobia bacterium ADurb.Bin231]